MGLKRFLVDRFKRAASPSMWRLLAPNWQLATGVRIELTSEADWIVYNDIFLDGEYDTPIEEALDRAGESCVVLDLGANVGFFSLRLIDRALKKGFDLARLRIFAVEGASPTFATLSRKLHFSGYGESVVPVHGLIGRRTGAGRILHSDQHGLSSTVSAPAGSRELGVDFVDLESLIGPVDRVDLLKCDIEGSELTFLENYPGLLQRVERGVFEWHDDLCDTRRCRGLLREAGLVRSVPLRDRPGFPVVMYART